MVGGPRRASGRGALVICWRWCGVVLGCAMVGKVGAAGGVAQLASGIGGGGRYLHTGGWPLGESPSWPSGVLVVGRRYGMWVERVPARCDIGRDMVYEIQRCMCRYGVQNKQG